MSKVVNETRRILVVDDNDAIHEDFRKSLGGGGTRSERGEKLAALSAALFKKELVGVMGSSFEVEGAMQGKEGLKKVQTAVAEGRPYTMAFVDMRMPPGWNGLETIKRLWQADPELQVVICTAYTDFSWGQISQELGASDRFLILKKPFDPMEVCQLATALSEKAKLVRQSSRQLAELERVVLERTAELRRLALFDKLTGLPNRAFLTELLEKTAQRAAADPAFQYGLLFIDFDRFKVINDSLGHSVGDEFLKAIAERLRKELAQSDDAAYDTKPIYAARLGGDEFVVVLAGITGEKEPVELANRLLALLSAPYALRGIEVTSSASIGVAVSDVDYHRADDLLRDADGAMYVAKAAGRARHVVFDKEMHRAAVSRLTLEADLRRALKNGELAVAYQPIVSFTDGETVSFEALARWEHPERGAISPVEFVPIAEETGLIVQLGEWVLEESLRQLRTWTDTLPAAQGLSMSVNCSRKQLTDPGFVGRVLAACERHGIAPSRLNLEVTESTIMEDQRNAYGVLQGLHDAGVHIHMDDFGTGYSSLNCLHGLPLDALKVDRSFIKNLSERRDYAAVINSIILLAHNLEIHVVAEGVEKPEHVALLSALECDMGQGYLFAKPMTPAMAGEYLAEGRKRVIGERN